MANDLSIDLRDPAVQNFLKGDSPSIATPQGKTLMTFAGDEVGGMQSKIDLDVDKLMVAVWYERKELLLELDVHALPGEPILLIAICPKCQNAIRIPGDRKRIEWDPQAENPMRRVIAARLPPHHVHRAARGRLSVEPFECTWEMNAKQAVSSDLTIGKGNLCRWRGAIDNNRVKEV